MGAKPDPKAKGGAKTPAKAPPPKKKEGGGRDIQNPIAEPTKIGPIFRKKTFP